MSQLPTALSCALGNAVKTLTQITLNGSHAYLKILCQPMFVNQVTPMQVCQDLGQALRQLFPFGAGAAGYTGIHAKWRRRRDRQEEM